MGACGGNFTTPFGLITSYLYPTDYPENVTCNYVVLLPIGSFIRLTILLLDVDCSSEHSDDLEMRDGDLEDSPLMIRFCNRDSYVPTHMSTSQNTFWMRYYFTMMRSKFYSKTGLFGVQTSERKSEKSKKSNFL